jgi:hypothetical protein
MDGETRVLEADYRRHAEIENAIRDLKYGVGLNHRPSGKFAANGAWLAVRVVAHNLARWTARIGLGTGIVTTKTLRRRLFSLAGRLTRSARRFTLHLPARWPWAIGFTVAFTRLPAIPLLAWPLAASSPPLRGWREPARERVPRPSPSLLGPPPPVRTASSRNLCVPAVSFIRSEARFGHQPIRAAGASVDPGLERRVRAALGG